MFSFKYTERQDFLKGAFHWKKMGYSYSCPPMLGLPSEEMLKDKDPWIALAAAVEFAKVGKHKNLDYLKNLVMREDTAPTLVSAVLDFIADAGSKSDLEILAELMLEGPKYLKIEACRSAKWAGEIWLVPFILEARLAMDRQSDRDAVEVVISSLLDPIHGEQCEFYDGNYNEQEYRDKVTVRVNTMIDTFGSDQVSILGGEPVDMPKLIWQMRKMLSGRQEKWQDWGAFLTLRHKFEAYTGADCSRFYEGDRFQPLIAAAVIEGYLEANPTQDFEAGVRYFFLHAIRE